MFAEQTMNHFSIKSVPELDRKAWLYWHTYYLLKQNLSVVVKVYPYREWGEEYEGSNQASLLELVDKKVWDDSIIYTNLDKTRSITFTESANFTSDVLIEIYSE
jgi:hypothetical protein